MVDGLENHVDGLFQTAEAVELETKTNPPVRARMRASCKLLIDIRSKLLIVCITSKLYHELIFIPKKPRHLRARVP